MLHDFLLSGDELHRRSVLEYAAKAFLGVSLIPAIPAFAQDKTKKSAAKKTGEKAAETGKAAAAGKGGSAKHVIFLCMTGGMTHIDTFDLKPGRETQGETKGIATKVPGMQFGETLPQLAKLADHLAVVRSLTTKTGDHDGGRYALRTAYKEIASIRHPTLGAWSMKILGKQNPSALDNVVIGTEPRHPGAGFLEPAYTPLPIADANVGLENTKSPSYLTDQSFAKRMELINRFDSGFRKKYPQKQVEAYTEYYQQANKLLHSEDVKAFDLAQEKDDIRDKYGRDGFGQGCLLARRLVEHDVRYIEIAYGNWDMHTDLYDATKLPEVAGRLDKAVATLLTDLKDRGLLNKTLIVLGTEFGRSPHVNANGGRDHHPGAFSGFFAGGGITGGRFYGTSDKDGHGVESDPVSMADFNATIAQALGLPQKEEFYSKSGRPFTVANGGEPLKLFS